MMCDQEKLIAYVLGDLEGEELAAMESHVSACPACADHAAQLRRTVGVMAALPEAESRPVSMRRLRAAIAKQIVAEQPTVRPARGIPRWRWSFALAAAAAIVIACFHYGIAVRVGQYEMAFGGPSRGVVAPAPTAPGTVAALDETKVRGMTREEIATQVVPVLSKLVQAVEDLDTRNREDMVTLRNAIAAQYVAGFNEVQRNIGLIANTVDERLGAR